MPPAIPHDMTRIRYNGKPCISCRSFAAIAVASALYTGNAQADYCQAHTSQGFGNGFESAESFPDESLGDSVILSADSAESDPTQPENIRLNGTIEIKHQGGKMSAENALYLSLIHI